MKIAFVVERYNADEPGEPGRRTRALAAAMTARGHDVTVLTTCAQRPGIWENDVAEGKTSLDGVGIMRFRITEPRHRLLARTAGALMSVHDAAGKVWAHAFGPVCSGYRRYLDHHGFLFDAVFFTGEWGYLPSEGMKRVRNAVLCPPPIDDATRKVGHGFSMLRNARAVAVATAGERELLASEVGSVWSSPTFVVGACAEPAAAETQRSRRMKLVDGPFLLHLGEHGPSTGALLESFRFFREAHGATPFEDDEGQPIVGRDLRLVLAGDFAFPHLPADGILSLGPVDDLARGVLLRGAMASVHADPSNRLPTSLLETWSLVRPALVHGRSATQSTVTEHVGSDYLFESPSTFASAAASLLSGRTSRSVFAARTAELAKRTHAPSKVADAMERCVRGVLGRSGSAGTSGDGVVI